jgi:hypothetical protein
MAGMILLLLLLFLGLLAVGVRSAGHQPIVVVPKTPHQIAWEEAAAKDAARMQARIAKDQTGKAQRKAAARDSVVEGVGVVLIGYPIMFLLAYVAYKLLSKFVWWITL